MLLMRQLRRLGMLLLLLRLPLLLPLPLCLCLRLLLRLRLSHVHVLPQKCWQHAGHYVLRRPRRAAGQLRRQSAHQICGL